MAEAEAAEAAGGGGGCGGGVGGVVLYLWSLGFVVGLLLGFLRGVVGALSFGVIYVLVLWWGVCWGAISCSRPGRVC